MWVKSGYRALLRSAVPLTLIAAGFLGPVVRPVLASASPIAGSFFCGDEDLNKKITATDALAVLKKAVSNTPTRCDQAKDILIVWSFPSQPVQPPVSFKIYYKLQDQTDYQVIKEVQTSDALMIKNSENIYAAILRRFLLPGQVISFRVSSIDSTGSESALSNIIQVSYE
ncbi:hypothetical protein D6827_03815 [Candidatus Parcubacteria bacterium]|nr:MAG: hypothetical protein D6827_03815 [Candidatus Parcubacteria bacterium]